MKKMLRTLALILSLFSLQTALASSQICTYELFDTHKYPSLTGLACFKTSDLDTIADKLSDYIILNAQALADDLKQARRRSATIISEPLIKEINQARQQLTDLSQFVADNKSLLNNKPLTDDEKGSLKAAIAKARTLLQ